ncbi:MAG: polyprenyl synthetase family protein [Bacteroidota bacterium]|nr:polyprenyl synthetase family protein [Bacteroidota bacterium]
MHSFKELSIIFEEKFNKRHFPGEPKNLYDAAQYLLTLGGKRIRPVICLMGNELFGEINPDSFHVAAAIELFHNFTLVHDDIMDKAPLRRGMKTVHEKYGESTALLAGDVMLVAAYEYLNKVSSDFNRKVISLFNVMARQVCEGQQLDMEFAENETNKIDTQQDTIEVNFDDYVKMIGLKTSVLLGASLRAGALLGGAGLGNQDLLYEFGKNLGIAFQVQDDYLDAFGDPEKFGKTLGGDILANKKTFLLIHALEAGSTSQIEELHQLMRKDSEHKIQRVLKIYKDCNVQDWALQLKQKFMSAAMENLEDTAVISSRKKQLEELAYYLLNREM